MGRAVAIGLQDFKGVIEKKYEVALLARGSAQDKILK